MQEVYKAFSRLEGVINSGHDIWSIIFCGPKLADAQTCGPHAEYNAPSIIKFDYPLFDYPFIHLPAGIHCRTHIFHQ